MTGFTVLGAKMSSLKNKQMKIIFGKNWQIKDYGTDNIYSTLKYKNSCVCF